MAIIFDLLEPAEANREIVESFSLEYLDSKYLFDVFKHHWNIDRQDAAFVLDLFEKEVETIVPILAAIFPFLEQHSQEGTLLRVVDNSIDGEILDQLNGLLLIDVVLEDFLVHGVQGIDLHELS